MSVSRCPGLEDAITLRGRRGKSLAGLRAPRPRPVAAALRTTELEQLLSRPGVFSGHAGRFTVVCPLQPSMTWPEWSTIRAAKSEVVPTHGDPRLQRPVETLVVECVCRS